jgi:hypothetical protein
MRLSARFARELLTEERERRDLALHRTDFVDNTPIRALYERRLARDPELTLPELARLADIPCETYLARMQGVALSRFGRTELYRFVVERSAEASGSTVGRWLAEDAIKPWQQRLWIFPREPNFLE